MITVTLVRGLPGSGKSTLAKKMLMSSISTLYYESDMFFTDSSGRFDFKPELLDDAHKWCIKKARKAVAYGYNVIVANTFSRIWEMEPYLKMAGRTIRIKVIKCTGRYRNVHGVPKSYIKSMTDRWENYPDEEVERT